MTLVFVIAFGLGAIYLLLMLLGGIGAVFDFDFNFGEGTDSTGEFLGIGGNVIASFLVGFGAVGLAGSLAEWNPLIVLAVAIFFGYVIGRIIAHLIGFFYAQQSDTVASSEVLVGLMAQVTINSPAGKIGEAIVENDGRRKFPIREVANMPLQRGDHVQIIAIDGHILNVKKKRIAQDDEIG